LKPDLNSPRRHAKFVSQVNPGLLIWHLVSLKDLLKNGQLVRTGPLALLLVQNVFVGRVQGVVGHLHTMELKQNHSKEHNLSFVLVLTVIETQFNNLLCIK